MTGGSRGQGTCLRWLITFAVATALCVAGPSLNWKFKKGFNFGRPIPSCPLPLCVCDCPRPLSVLQIAPGLANLSVADCGSNDPDLKTEMEKQYVDLLTEEMKLREAVSVEHDQHMNVTLAEARRVASQYQREAEKCNAATETCEEARERTEALLIKEKKLTSLWERQARRFGWEGD